MFCKKGVFENLANQRCFPANFAKFSRTHFSTEHLGWLLLKAKRKKVLSEESIKRLTKSELKTELIKRGLPSNGRNNNLLKRLTETLNEQSNKVDEMEKQLQNISIETIKELFIEMFKAQEETIRKIVSSCNSDTIVR